MIWKKKYSRNFILQIIYNAQTLKTKKNPMTNLDKKYMIKPSVENALNYQTRTQSTIIFKDI